MGIESGVVTRLNAVTAVTDLVGSRIYANTLADGVAHPAIIYQVITDFPFDSILGSDPGKSQSRIQFTLIADTTAGRIAVCDAVQSALKRFQGASDDVTILDSRLENITDLPYDIDTDQTARVADYIFYYEVT